LSIPVGIAAKKFVKPEVWEFTRPWHCEAEPNATDFAKKLGKQMMERRNKGEDVQDDGYQQPAQKLDEDA
jgi:hypothetical protein